MRVQICRDIQKYQHLYLNPSCLMNFDQNLPIVDCLTIFDSLTIHWEADTWHSSLSLKWSFLSPPLGFLSQNELWSLLFMLGGTGGTMQKRWCRCVKLGSRFPDLIWTTKIVAARFPCVKLVFACWSRGSCKFRIFCLNEGVHVRDGGVESSVTSCCRSDGGRLTDCCNFTDVISWVVVAVEGSLMEVDDDYHGRCSRNWICVLECCTGVSRNCIHGCCNGKDNASVVAMAAPTSWCVVNAEGVSKWRCMEALLLQWWLLVREVARMVWNCCALRAGGVYGGQRCALHWIAMAPAKNRKMFLDQFDACCFFLRLLFEKIVKVLTFY